MTIEGPRRTAAARAPFPCRRPSAGHRSPSLVRVEVLRREHARVRREVHARLGGGRQIRHACDVAAGASVEEVDEASGVRVPSGAGQPRAVGTEGQRGDARFAARLVRAPSRRRVTASRNTTVPSSSPTASVRPSGCSAMAFSSVAVAAHDRDRGRARRSTASRLSRVTGASSRATAWRASSSERSSALLARAPAHRAAGPRRRAPRRVPGLAGRARPRAAIDGEHQQRHDAGEHEPQATPGALAGGPARVEELLLGGVELRLVLGAPLERRRQPCAAVELAAIAPLGSTRVAACGQAGDAGAGPRCPPRASRAAAATRAGAPRARPRPRRRSTVSRRRSASTSTTRATSSLRSASSSASGTRRRTTAPPSPSPASRSRTRRAAACCVGSERAEGVLGQPRHGAAGRRPLRA